MSTLNLRGIEKYYGKTKVLHGIDLDIEEGEFVVFVGPSGCGKSTLLRSIAGLEEIDGGDLMMNGERINDVSPEHRGISMVFQNYALYPHMTVAENMGFALKIAGVAKAKIDARVRASAKMLQIDHLLDRRPKAMSGGQKQRVAIGRAITRNPKVFLFDEPLSNLDASLRVQMRVELTKLHSDLKSTMIYVTHDQTEAMTMADKIVILRAGQIEQVGTPLELYNKPANKFVAGFIGNPSMNFMEGKVTAISEKGELQVTLPGGQALTLPARQSAIEPGSPISLGARPQSIEICDDKSGFPIHVNVVEQLGNESLIYGTMGEDTKLTIARPGQVGVKAGDMLHCSFEPAHIHVFDENGEALQAKGEDVS